eukprot:TRINITY_DN8498_c0_g1_i1.p1 TRINITY_DN8498_c0_g1~~TRINITY_DN8498_c0_g1_i1.p1  ORF type:complete len:207 (-),score=8.80 TRINITY_DN8498_c0_g1_i1:253-873(-)
MEMAGNAVDVGTSLLVTSVFYVPHISNLSPMPMHTPKGNAKILCHRTSLESTPNKRLLNIRHLFPKRSGRKESARRSMLCSIKKTILRFNIHNKKTCSSFNTEKASENSSRKAYSSIIRPTHKHPANQSKEFSISNAAINHMNIKINSKCVPVALGNSRIKKLLVNNMRTQRICESSEVVNERIKLREDERVSLDCISSRVTAMRN